MLLLTIYKKWNSYFSKVTLLIADILSHDCLPFEKLLPKLSELLFQKKLHTVLPGSELVEIDDESSLSSLCAFVHAGTLSADVFQTIKVIDERLQHRISTWNQNFISNKYA